MAGLIGMSLAGRPGLYEPRDLIEIRKALHAHVVVHFLNRPTRLGYSVIIGNFDKIVIGLY